ncbi:MAG: ATP-binding cassette domain-containing protein [Defluviitaleaceae bacterium]|nr:ATP-binding cassette domain-containing protein [Defluviitaleaceae bacterium]
MFIKVENLVKSYENVHAVKGISFNVREGMLFSYLGVNGAGKSTTINILTTLLGKTSGRVEIGGYDIEKNSHEVRSIIGVVFQESVLDEKLTIRENLTIRGGLYNMRGAKLKEAVNNAIKMTDISEFADRHYEKLSGGQRRRADIARALINMPKLLFLDEPTTGLDPKTRRDIWQLIRDLQKTRGMTVFLTTHYMEEAAESDDIAVIHKGEIVARGTPTELKEQYAYDILKMELTNGTKIEERLKSTTEAIPHIDKHRENISHLEVISGTLDDVFINLTEGLENVN